MDTVSTAVVFLLGEGLSNDHSEIMSFDESFQNLLVSSVFIFPLRVSSRRCALVMGGSPTSPFLSTTVSVLGRGVSDVDPGSSPRTGPPRFWYLGDGDLHGALFVPLWY